MVTEDDLTSGGGQYTDPVSQNYILKTYIVLLTNVTPINLLLPIGIFLGGPDIIRRTP